MPESGTSTITRISLLIGHLRSNLKPIRAYALVFVCVIVAGSIQQAGAQTFRGTILGTVTDPQNAVIAGATVTAKNVGTGIQRATVTDDVGNFVIPELPIGVYEVSIQGPSGFKLARVTDVKVEIAG